MQRLIRDNAITGGLIAALMVFAFYASDADAQAIGKYEITENGTVGQGLYLGWRTFNGNCMRCHGSDASGSSFAPSLYDRLEGMPKPAFDMTVQNGIGLMPAFKGNANVIPYTDELWAYLHALTNNKLPPGQPTEAHDPPP